VRTPDLAVATTIDEAAVLDGLSEYTERIVDGTLSLLEDVGVGSPEHDGTSAVLFAVLELDHLVLSDHDLLDAPAEAEFVALARRLIEGAEDVGPGDRTEAFDSVEVGVLDADDALLGEELFWLVLDQLSVHEHVWLVTEDFLDLVAHLVLLGLLDLPKCDQ